jgi:hypothetical protein
MHSWPLAARSLLLVAISLHPGLAQTSDQPGLMDAETEVDEVVVDTSFAIPLEILSSDYPFKNFRYPFVDATGRVLFVGNDRFKYGPARHHNGIYESLADGTLQALATEETIVAEDGQPVGPILGLRTDFTSFIFHRGNSRAISLMGRIRGGPLRELVSRRTHPPRSATPFAFFLYGDIEGNWMVFNGTTKENPWTHGLYHLDVDTGELLCLLQNNEFLEPFGAVLGNFSWQPDLASRKLVFAAHRLDPTGEECLPGRGILGWSIDTTAGRPEQQLALERLELFAPFGMEIPESGGLSLHWANDPVTDGKMIAAVGGHDASDHLRQPPDYQALLLRTPDGQWHNPIDTHTYVPRQEELGLITSFNPWVALAEDKAIFIARGPEDYEAIYIYDPEDASLYFVLDTLTPIEDRLPIGFEISPHPLVGQRLAFMARFADGTSAILRASLPGLKVHPRRQSANSAEL